VNVCSSPSVPSKIGRFTQAVFRCRCPFPFFLTNNRIKAFFSPFSFFSVPKFCGFFHRIGFWNPSAFPPSFLFSAPRPGLRFFPSLLPPPPELRSRVPDQKPCPLAASFPPFLLEGTPFSLFLERGLSRQVFFFFMVPILFLLFFKRQAGIDFFSLLFFFPFDSPARWDRKSPQDFALPLFSRGVDPLRRFQAAAFSSSLPFFFFFLSGSNGPNLPFFPSFFSPSPRCSHEGLDFLPGGRPWTDPFLFLLFTTNPELFSPFFFFFFLFLVLLSSL